MPNVYKLIITLKHDEIDSESTTIGFRHNCIKNGLFLHNNIPITIRGVNRHEHDERRGKAITEESMIKDIELIKQHNFNAIRCSHYPNDIKW